MSFVDSPKERELKELLSHSKRLASEGKLLECFRTLEQAYKIQPQDKILRRMERIKSVVGYDPASRNDKLDVTKSRSIPQSTSDSSSSCLSPTSLSRFKALKSQAKSLACEGQYQEAIDHFQECLQIYDCPKLRKYMQEVQLVMSSTKAFESDSCNPPEIDEDLVAPEVFLEQGSSVSGHNPTNTVNGKLADMEKTNIEKSTSSGDYRSEKSSSNGELSEGDLNEKLAQVKEAYEEARRLAEDGHLEKSLKLLQKAQSIHKTEKVRKRIEKLQQFLAVDVNTEEDTSMEVADGFSVHHALYNKLYPYQREGVKWLWNLYSNGNGGVLADDMGLGKTFQVIAFLSGLIDADLVKHVLIIMPVTLIPTWQNEFEKWCPGIHVNCFHGASVKDRNRNLLRAQRGGHVLLTTYGLVLHQVDALTTLDGRTFVWDYLILDEGHKIKNPTKTTKAIYEIPSKTRLVLTATPIQNNLREMWSLFDFALQGTLLGSSKTFKMQYENPISRAREKDATAGEKRLGTEMAENLKSLIQPYFLRRVKDDAWKKQLEEVERSLDKLKITSLKKNDLILWVYLSDIQLEIYKEFLHSDAVKSILLTKKSPLVELTVLKKICDHPRLLSHRACLQLGLHSELQQAEIMEKIEDESSAAPSIQNVSDEKLLEESGKLKLVVALLENLKSSGHRTLIFSMSKKVLDMLHRILINRQWKVIRIDGTCALSEREKRIEKFQTDSSYPVFLLTTQVGGVGLTLTAADRVIIYDPSWNPATDAQAVDRAFRIGQQKNVVVYRLITCGTVEEKIYRRQVFKDSITRQTTGDADPFRYFSKQELRELFKLDNPHHSVTQVQLSQLHQRSADEKLDLHIRFLETLGIFGISDHDLMFTGNLHDASEDHDENAVSEHFIKEKVATARNMIKSEASITADGLRLANTYCRPYQEIIPLPKKTPKAPMVPLYQPPPTSYETIDLTDTDKPLPQKLSFSSMQNEVDEDKENKGVLTELKWDEGRHSPKKHNRTLSDEIVIDVIDLSSDKLPGVTSPTDRKFSIPSASPPGHAFRESMREKDEQLSRHDAFQDLDLDIDLDISRQSVGKKRRSCVRKLPFPSNSDDSSDEVDSSKIADVPDSACNTRSNTPQLSRSCLTISESPLLSSHFEADVLGQRHAGSVRRITPLKVGKNVSQKDEYFAQAMATSLIITPYSSPKETVTGTLQAPVSDDTAVELCNESIINIDESNLSVNERDSSHMSFEVDDMSPIYHKKKGRAAVSESNDEEHSSDIDRSILDTPSSGAKDNNGSIIGLKKKRRRVKLVDSDEDFEDCNSDKDDSALSGLASEANNSVEDNEESIIRVKRNRRIVQPVNSDSDEDFEDCNSDEDNSVLSGLASEANNSVEGNEESIIRVKRSRRIVKPVVSDSDEDYEEHSSDKDVPALPDHVVTETNDSNNEESSLSKDLEYSVSEGKPSQSVVTETNDSRNEERSSSKDLEYSVSKGRPSQSVVTDTNDSRNEERSSSEDLEHSVSEGKSSQSNVGNKEFDESIVSLASDRDEEVFESKQHEEDKSNYSGVSSRDDSDDYDEESDSEDSDSGKSVGSESLFDDV